MADSKKTGKQTQSPMDPFGFSQMFQDSFSMFDPDRVAQMFDPQKVFAQMPAMKSADMDMNAIIKQNQASFEAMVEANKSAAATYQDMLEKQMDIFNRMTTAAQDVAKNTESPVSTDAAAKNSQVYAEAAETAFNLMREMAEAAQSANQEAFDRLSGQVTQAMDKMKNK
ncbi:MAG: phasin family protein [Phycisphaerales bacterium]